MPRPTTEVLTQLAEKVHGWKRTCDKFIMRGEFHVVPTGEVYGGGCGEPLFSTREQALDLLDAWAGLGSTEAGDDNYRWWSVSSRNGWKHAMCYIASRTPHGYSLVSAPTLPEAIVAVVCKAEGIGGE